MTILHAIILGIVQGLTEFLPISSSAHLVLVPYFLGWKIPSDVAFMFDVLVQLGTLAAVIIYFWRDLVEIVVCFIQGILQRKPFANESARLGWYLILATIPAGLFGLTIKNLVENAFSSAAATGAFLIFTAILLVVAEFSRRLRSFQAINWKDSLVMGLFQAISVFPGVSRSGATMTGGMLRNLDRPAAARFSFLMSIPVMLAAGVLEGKDLSASAQLTQLLPVFILGFLAAAVVGYLSIRWLLRYLTNHSLIVFAAYTAAVGVLAITIALIRG